MKQKKNAGADTGRILALLWSSHTKPGRSGLTVRSIVTVAIELADAAGLETVSMRQIADRLGVGAMSLYTHVPGKEELTYLMIDTVVGELYADVDEPARQAGGWRGALEFIAARNWNLYERHSWLLQIVNARPILGPNTILRYEAELRPLDGLGLSELEMDGVLTLVLTHVEGTARAQANLKQTYQDTGMSDAEWWVAAEPLLGSIIDTKRFPVASRVGQKAGEVYQAASDPRHSFRFGLERILDGVALLIAARQ